MASEDNRILTPTRPEFRMNIVPYIPIPPKRTAATDPAAQDKRAKATDAKLARLRAGNISQILDGPADIFFEIIGHLEPLDLLNLAQSYKGLRAVLMSTSARHMWVAARKNVPGLPDCPPYLSEPRYAAVVFGSDCFACGRGRSSKVDFGVAVRFCSPCWKHNIVTWAKGAGRFFFDEGKLMNSLMPGTALAHDEASYTVPIMYRAEMNAVMQKFKSLPQPLRDEFVEERKLYAKTMYDHGVSVSLWLTQKLERKREQAERVKEGRRNAIIKKLGELGYHQGDFPSDDVTAWHSYFNQPTELSDRIWKNIRPKLECLLEAEKNRRREAVAPATQ